MISQRSSRRWAIEILAAALLLACRSSPPPAPAVADAAPANVASAEPAQTASAPASATTVAAPSASAPQDLPRVTYVPAGGCYVRYDRPSFFTEDPPPLDGHGLGYSWGKRATIECGWFYNPENMTIADYCKEDPKRTFTMRAVKGTSCFESWKAGSTIYWSRAILLADGHSPGPGGVLVSLYLTYDASLKDYFDPIVARVNASVVLPPE